MGYERFHSTRGEDRIVRQLCSPPLRGVFVDVGAGPPCDGNNTVHFERSGWTGLCIDAHPKVVDNLRRERTCPVAHFAVGDYPQITEAKFFLAGDANLSSTLPGRPCIEEISVPAASLEEVLCLHGIGKIDLLSIDAEGCDLKVWRSMNWERHRPTVVIIEPGSDRWEIMAELTNCHTGYQYRLIAETEDNLIFKTDLEWQLVDTETDEWVFGVKVRGAIRNPLGAIYFDENREDERGGWVWTTLCLDYQIRGVTDSRIIAIRRVEAALGEVK